jgi:hypothetical protein
MFLFGIALNVQVYLQMHRPDHKEKHLRVMQKLEKDHTLTQLASAWVHLVMVTNPSRPPRKAGSSCTALPFLLVAVELIGSF